MARRSGWQKTLADLFKKDISREVQTPQCYLNHARKCMEHATRMTSTSTSTSLQFNHGQCAHLAKELEDAVQTAEACALIYSSNITAETAGILKLLCRCAKEVETFIQSCRQDNWVQAAVVLSNVSAHVSKLSFDLEFCTMLLRKNTILKAAKWQELVELDFLDVQSELVNEIVTRDQRALLTRLEAMNQSSISSDEEHQLVSYLSGRLNQHLSGVVESKVWEIDFSSLRQVQRLGSGSVGMVCKSTWLGAEVAEKMFYGTDHPGFRNEVEILAGLTHPNIVPLLGYAMDKSRCSIVMELMDGDLSFLMVQRLQQHPSWDFPFTNSEAVDMMLQTAEGMLYLHDNRVVHRDLKSQNILVKRRKGIDAEYIYLKVADFGLSKTKERSSTYSNPTLKTGTTRWMAPELISQGEHDPHVRTELRYPFKVDVYSFGMVCYEILTGEVPFSTIGSFKEIKSMVLADKRPELPDECLPDLRSLIHACWESEPRQRPSFGEICKRLRCVKYLFMRGSGVTIDAHRLEYEDMKKREARQKEEQERETTAREEERQKREAIARQHERERRAKREAMARQKASKARQNEGEQRGDRGLPTVRDSASQKLREEAMTRQKESEARQNERLFHADDQRHVSEERAFSKGPWCLFCCPKTKKRQERGDSPLPSVRQASREVREKAIARQNEIAEKMREASQNAREARQKEREEREAPARRKIRAARQKEIREREEREAIACQKIREAIARGQKISAQGQN